MRDKMNVKKIFVSNFCFGALALTCVNLPLTLSAGVNTTPSVQNDTTVIYGKLNNGLTYYIKNNNDNSGRICYSLTLKAGSLDEDESQRGLAHFNEHLSFEGTPSFPQGIIDGSFIPDIDKKKFYTNALTTQTETVYSLMLPAVRETLTDTALILLKEWLYCDFDSDVSIRKERDIIAKEWLNFQDVAERGRKLWYPVFYNNSKWAYRQSIGELDIINKADKNEIVRFRKEWYRPELAAISVVGELDPSRVEAKIQALFKEYPKNKIKRDKEVVEIPDNMSRKTVVYTDKDQQFSFFSIYHRRQNPDLYTESGIKLTLKYALMNIMMSGRMFDIQESNSDVVSYLGANSYYLMKPDWIFSPSASVVNGKMREALRLVAREQERIAQHGFLDSEFSKAKDAVKKKYEQIAKSGSSKSNVDWTKSFGDHFLLNAPFCLPADEAKAFLPVLATITPDEMEAFHAELWNAKNSTVVIAVPESDLATAPDEQEVLRILDEVKNEKLAPYQEIDLSKPLFDAADFGKPGVVKKQESLCALPVYKYKLSNGAEVVFFNDTTKHGEILFEAVSHGGKSLLTPDQAVVADLACELFNEGPVGNYSYNHFQRYLGNSSMRMNIYVSNETEGIKGSVSSDAFVQLMQRMYMLFHHLELPADKYQSLLDGKKDRYFALKNTNENQFASFVEASLSGRRPETLQSDVSLVALERLLKDRFASPSDFTFYFTGAVQDVDFEKLTAQYLGGGKKMKREEYSGRYKTTLQGESELVLRKGTDERAVVQYIIGAPYEMNMDNMSVLQAVNPMINQRLQQRIREELHLVYDIRSELKLKATPEARAHFEIVFNCNPADVSRIAKEVHGVFVTFAAEGPDEAELSNVKKMMLRSKKRFESDNAFRLGCIRSHDQSLKNNYTQQINNISFIESMTTDHIQRILSQILNGKGSVKALFSLKSEKN